MLAAGIPLAGKLLPFLLKAGSAAKLPAVLRTAGAVGGGLPSLMRGDLGGALLGGGFGGVQDVAQGLTLSGQGGGLREPMIIAGKEGSGGIGSGIAGAAGGYLQGGPVGAVIGGIGGLFCDVRVKEDIAPLQKSEVNDLLSECAFFVKDLNECS